MKTGTDIPESLEGQALSDPRPRRLTGELLDWTINALTAVLTTDLGDHKAARQSLVRALKYADQLYPLTLGHEPSEPTEPGWSDPDASVEVIGLPAERRAQLGPAGSDALG
jgi:hypothetical protein